MAPQAPSPETTTQIDAERAYGLGRIMATGILALTGGSFIGMAYGAGPTDIKIGPHDATAELTAAPHTTIDFGPLGTAEKPTGWEMGGIKITVGGIPDSANQTALGNASSTVTQYEQLLADPAHIKQEAIHTVTTRIVHDGITGAAEFGAAGLGTLGLMAGPRRRKQHARRTVGELEGATDEQKAALLSGIDSAQRPWARVCGGILVTSMLLATACGDMNTQPSKMPDQAVDHVLDGTPLEGFAVHGALLKLLIDEGGGRLKDFIQADDKYYNQVAANFASAFAHKFGEAPLAHDNLIYVLSTSDNHCNLGMDRVHGTIANAFKVDGVIDSGDMTMSGTSAEEECVSAEADVLKGPGRKLLFAAGNHDSPATEAQAIKHGFTVLSPDKPADLAGLKVIGASDPNESVIGTPIHPRGSETIADVAAALARAARAERPDILVGHEYEMVQPAANAGNVPFTIAGHTHTFVPPKEVNEDTGSYIMTQGTSGGAKKDTLTIGPLQQTAVETVLVFDKATKRVIGYYLIQSHPNQSVEISDFQPILPDPVLSSTVSPN